MKVKVFEGKHGNELEKEINQWLDENSVEVKHISQSECSNGENYNTTLSIWYEPKPK